MAYPLPHASQATHLQKTEPPAGQYKLKPLGLKSKDASLTEERPAFFDIHIPRGPRTNPIAWTGDRQPPTRSLQQLARVVGVDTEGRHAVVVKPVVVTDTITGRKCMRPQSSLVRLPPSKTLLARNVSDFNIVTWEANQKLANLLHQPLVEKPTRNKMSAHEFQRAVGRRFDIISGRILD